MKASRIRGNPRLLNVTFHTDCGLTASRASADDASAAASPVAALRPELPRRQRMVVELRDVHGLPADEVCDMLALSAANQRVLLHRARAKRREQLETYDAGLNEQAVRP